MEAHAWVFVCVYVHVLLCECESTCILMCLCSIQVQLTLLSAVLNSVLGYDALGILNHSSIRKNYKPGTPGVRLSTSASFVSPLFTVLFVSQSLVLPASVFPQKCKQFSIISLLSGFHSEGLLWVLFLWRNLFLCFCIRVLFSIEFIDIFSIVIHATNPNPGRLREEDQGSQIRLGHIEDLIFTQQWLLQYWISKEVFTCSNRIHSYCLWMHLVLRFTYVTF